MNGDRYEDVSQGADREDIECWDGVELEGPIADRTYSPYAEKFEELFGHKPSESWDD